MAIIAGMIKTRLKRFSLASLMAVVLLFALYFARVAEHKRRVNLAHAALNGEWVASVQLNGKDILEELALSLKFDGNEVSVPDAATSNIRILPDAKPWRLDMIAASGEATQCIFRVEGEELVIIHGQDAGRRPASFDEDFKGRTVLRLRRDVKPEKTGEGKSEPDPPVRPLQEWTTRLPAAMRRQSMINFSKRTSRGLLRVSNSRGSRIHQRLPLHGQMARTQA